MRSVTDTSSSTTPVRAWYLTRQCLGPIPIMEWGDEAGLRDYVLAGFFANRFSPGVADRDLGWPDRRWVTISSGASSASYAVVAPLQVDDCSARTVSAFPASQNHLEPRIAHSIARFYELADEEWFEDGMRSNLSVGLEVLLRQHPAISWPHGRR
jgi:hypothetical protein